MYLSEIPREILMVMAGIFGLLVTASLVNLLLVRLKPDSDFRELTLRIKSWWIMATLFTLAIVISRNISIAFFAFLKLFWLLKEYFTLIPTQRAHRHVLFWAYLSIPVQFFWIYVGWYGMFIIFIPVYMFLLIPFVMILIGENKGFLRTVGTVHWADDDGVRSEPYRLPVGIAGRKSSGGGRRVDSLPGDSDPLYHVAQYIWGKSFGRHQVVPKVSPNKTVEGLLGGALSTVALAFLLAPLLTPLDTWHTLTSGLLIGLGGFIGDVNISALKRDLGVKDSGSMIPGHGGILDRVDSLTYTASFVFPFHPLLLLLSRGENDGTPALVIFTVDCPSPDPDRTGNQYPASGAIAKKRAGNLGGEPQFPLGHSGDDDPVSFRMPNRIRPVAAADYFLKNRWMAWFSLNIMHIIPLQRKGGKKNRDLFQGIYTALDQGDLVILYPEGSRGEPERLQRYKSGIYHLARKRPDVPIHPIFMHGLGKALPKGDPILVPFFCDVFVGEPFRWQEDKQAFMEELNLRMAELAGEGDFAPWE